jgi:colanic acid/amylovoran biosynthesis protein
MKKIMLHAYCADNLGDDLFIKYICDSFPNTSFHLQVDGEFGAGLSQIKNLTVHRPGFCGRGLNKITGRWVTREHLARGCDGLVHVGGSVFIQNGNWRRKQEQYSRLLQCAKEAYVIGANFGPYDTADYLDSYKSLVASRLQGICFRDSYSYGLFSEGDNVSWAPDILFAPDYSKYISCDGNRAVISLMNKGEEYLCKMAELGDLLSSSGYEVTLMSFCSREGDTKACMTVSERMKAPCRIYFYAGDPEEALSVFGGADLIVASRFHSMILGWAMGKRVFPVVYSEKMRHVIDDICPDCNFCHVQDIRRLNVRAVLDADAAPGNLSELRRLAGQHIELIRGLVE